jgi:ABC-2 type transport system permease protein
MTIAPALTDSRVMIGRCLRRSPRDPEAFFTALILPIALMLLFVYVFGGALKTGVAYVDYVVPGLIVLCAGFGAGTTAVSVATDMTNGIVDRFRSMPVSGASILVGHVVASVVRNLIATMTFILMFIPYVSTAFVPASTMPAVLRAFAEHQPFTPVIETMRGLWMGDTSTGAGLGHESVLAVVYCVVVLACSALVASRLFVRRTAA